MAELPLPSAPPAPERLVRHAALYIVAPVVFMYEVLPVVLFMEVPEGSPGPPWCGGFWLGTIGRLDLWLAALPGYAACVLMPLARVRRAAIALWAGASVVVVLAYATATICTGLWYIETLLAACMGTMACCAVLLWRLVSLRAA